MNKQYELKFKSREQKEMNNYIYMWEQTLKA
jgi:hypothetical protein